MQLLMIAICCNLLVVVASSFSLLGSSRSSRCRLSTSLSILERRHKATILSASMTSDSIMNDTRIGYNEIIKENYSDNPIVMTMMTQPQHQQQQQQQVHEQSLASAAMPSGSSPVMTMPSITRPTASDPPQRQTVHTISSMEELLAVMNGKLHEDDEVDTTQNDNQLTVIKYYADYCKLCQRASIQMKRLVSEFPTTVHFAKVEQAILTAPSAETLRALGVTKFPFVQIYRRGQCVASFSTGPSHMFRKRVLDTIRLCLERSPDAWQEFYNEFATPIQENADTRERLLAGIRKQQQQPNMGP